VPSQQQLRWSQLKVGVTVIIASIVLAVLIFLMSGTSGPFTRRMTFYSYFQSTQGLRVGAPVTLEGVTIGNVKRIKLVEGRQLDPVEVTMKVDPDFGFRIRKDSTAALATAGVLGELFVDISSKGAKGQQAKNGDILVSAEATQIEDVVKAGQGTLQNMDVLLKRMDRILAGVENGEGSVGKILKDPELYNRANNLLSQMQDMLDSVNKGRGSIGKLLNNDELYNKVNASVDKLSKIVDDINAGKGNAGKLLKDESLYNNLNATSAKLKSLMDDIDAGKGTLGKVAKDPEFAKKVDDTITNLRSLTEKMDSAQGSVGKMFNDPSLYNNADQMLVETRNLVKAIRENPKKYLTIHFKLF
jgi:phospholipid/cholesterol/gamma-HCH transport system substrate-binding protein